MARACELDHPVADVDPHAERADGCEEIPPPLDPSTEAPGRTIERHRLDQPVVATRRSPSSGSVAISSNARERVVAPGRIEIFSWVAMGPVTVG